MQKNQRLKIVIAAALTMAALSVSGCEITLTEPLSHDTAPDRPAGEAEFPITVGLYFSPEFLSFDGNGLGPFSSSISVKHVLPVGQASADMLDEIFYTAFEAVQFIDTRPPLSANEPAVAFVVEPRINMFSRKLTGLGEDASSNGVEIEFLLKFYDIHGSPILSRYVTGRTTYTESSNRSVERAIEEAGRNIMKLLYNDAELRSWLNGLAT